MYALFYFRSLPFFAHWWITEWSSLLTLAFILQWLLTHLRSGYFDAMMKTCMTSALFIDASGLPVPNNEKAKWAISSFKKGQILKKQTRTNKGQFFKENLIKNAKTNYRILYNIVSFFRIFPKQAQNVLFSSTFRKDPNMAKPFYFWQTVSKKAKWQPCDAFHVHLVWHASFTLFAARLIGETRAWTILGCAKIGSIKYDVTQLQLTISVSYIKSPTGLFGPVIIVRKNN